jgi:hypothetical protein
MQRLCRQGRAVVRFMRDGFEGLFSGDKDRRSRALHLPDGGGVSRSINQAGASKQRGKIPDLAVMIEHFVVQRREELRQAHILRRCDLFQSIPERHFQADRRAMASYPQRSGLGFVVALRLMREQLAHGFLSSSIYRFLKPYTCRSGLTMLEALRNNCA